MKDIIIVTPSARLVTVVTNLSDITSSIRVSILALVAGALSMLP